MLMAILVALSVFATVVHFYAAPAKAHDWYPMECCNNQDCAPVDNLTWFVPAGGGHAPVGCDVEAWHRDCSSRLPCAGIEGRSHARLHPPK